MDCTSGFWFLVDTGAEVSVLPTSRCPTTSLSPGPPLQAAKQSPIATHGICSLALNLGLRRPFNRTFIITDVHHPILGFNFLGFFNMLVGVARNRLVNNLTQLRIHGISTHKTSPSPTLPRSATKDDFLVLLEEFPAHIRPPPPDQPIRHDVTHHITTSGPPASAHP